MEKNRVDRWNPGSKITFPIKYRLHDDPSDSTPLHWHEPLELIVVRQGQVLASVAATHPFVMGPSRATQ